MSTPTRGDGDEREPGAEPEVEAPAPTPLELHPDTGDLSADDQRDLVRARLARQRARYVDQLGHPTRDRRR